MVGFIIIVRAAANWTCVIMVEPKISVAEVDTDSEFIFLGILFVGSEVSTVAR